MIRSIAVVAIAALLALSGSALAVSTATPSSPTASTAPQLAGTGTVDATNASNTTNATEPNGTNSNGTAFPPGTSANGIENVTALLNAHAAALANQTYTERLNVSQVRTVTENGTVLWTKQAGASVTVEHGTDTALSTLDAQNVTASGRHLTEAVWVDGNRSAIRITNASGIRNRMSNRDQNASGNGAQNTTRNATQNTTRNATNETVYASAPTPPGGEPVWSPWAGLGTTSGDVLGSYLRSAHYNYTGTVAQDNQTLYEFTTVESTSPVGADVMPSANTTTHATVLVDSDGVIHSMNASEQYDFGNETVTRNVTYAVSNVGSTTPVAPAWLAQLPTIDTTLSENGTLLTLHHTGGATVSNPYVDVSAANTSRSGQLNGSFTVNDTAYAYAAANATTLTVTRTPPSANDSLATLGTGTPATATYRLVSQNGTVDHTAFEVTITNTTNATTPNGTTTNGTGTPPTTTTTTEPNTTTTPTTTTEPNTTTALSTTTTTEPNTTTALNTTTTTEPNTTTTVPANTTAVPPETTGNATTTQTTSNETTNQTASTTTTSG